MTAPSVQATTDLGADFQGPLTVGFDIPVVVHNAGDMQLASGLVGCPVFIVERVISTGWETTYESPGCPILAQFDPPEMFTLSPGESRALVLHVLGSIDPRAGTRWKGPLTTDTYRVTMVFATPAPIEILAPSNTFEVRFE